MLLSLGKESQATGMCRVLIWFILERVSLSLLNDGIEYWPWAWNGIWFNGFARFNWVPNATEWLRCHSIICRLRGGSRATVKFSSYQPGFLFCRFVSQFESRSEFRLRLRQLPSSWGCWESHQYSEWTPSSEQDNQGNGTFQCIVSETMCVFASGPVPLQRSRRCKSSKFVTHGWQYRCWWDVVWLGCLSAVNWSDVMTAENRARRPTQLCGLLTRRSLLNSLVDVVYLQWATINKTTLKKKTRETIQITENQDLKKKKEKKREEKKKQIQIKKEREQ